MERVVITRPLFSVATMQVCAVADATDEEILEVCNRENPTGLENGWNEVVREANEGSIFKNENKLPVQCADDPGRTHFLVLC